MGPCLILVVFVLWVLCTWYATGMHSGPDRVSMLLLMAKILLKEFPVFWYTRSCKMFVINSRGPLGGSWHLVTTYNGAYSPV